MESLSDIQIVETLNWSWRQIFQKGFWPHARNIFIKSLFFGLFLGLMGSVTDWAAILASEGLNLGIKGFVLGTLSGLVFWTLFELFTRGANVTEIEIKIKSNQGIVGSAKNAVQIGTIFGLIIGLFVAVFVMIGLGPMTGIALGLSAGLLGGFVTGLVYGGSAVVKHFVLRFILNRNNYLPLRLVPFLDDMVTHGMLHRVGGGYTFMHKSLMDYFAKRKK